LSPGESRGFAFLLVFLVVFWEKWVPEGGFLMVKTWCYVWWMWFLKGLFFGGGKCAAFSTLFLSSFHFETARSGKRSSPLRCDGRNDKYGGSLLRSE
jgi:hypothetical protein